MSRAAETGLWRTGEVIPDEQRLRLERVADRLGGCSSSGWWEECDCGLEHHSWCCNSPPCPRHQRAEMWRRVGEARDIFNALPDGVDGCSWKGLTVALRHSGDLATDIARTWAMMRELSYVLEHEYGALAGWCSMEMAFDGVKPKHRKAAGQRRRPRGRPAELRWHVHVHVLVYCRWLHRRDIQIGSIRTPGLQSWLRSRDCTVPGCTHPGDDRCPECKRLKRACGHLDGNRVRCNGSWYVDVRSVRDRHPETGRRGLVEWLKYETAPIAPSWRDSLKVAELIARWHMQVGRGRPRLVRFGAALDRAWWSRLEDRDDKAAVRRLDRYLGAKAAPIVGRDRLEQDDAAPELRVLERALAGKGDALPGRAEPWQVALDGGRRAKLIERRHARRTLKRYLRGKPPPTPRGRYHPRLMAPDADVPRELVRLYASKDLGRLAGRGQREVLPVGVRDPEHSARMLDRLAQAHAPEVPCAECNKLKVRVCSYHTTAAGRLSFEAPETSARPCGP